MRHQSKHNKRPVARVLDARSVGCRGVPTTPCHAKACHTDVLLTSAGMATAGASLSSSRASMIASSDIAAWLALPRMNTSFSARVMASLLRALVTPLETLHVALHTPGICLVRRNDNIKCIPPTVDTGFPLSGC